MRTDKLVKIALPWLVLIFVLLSTIVGLITAKPAEAIWPDARFRLTVDVRPSFGGTVEIDQTTPSFYPTTSTSSYGTSVRLEAIPAYSYQFDNWSGDLSSTTNLTTVVIGGNKKITANFSQARPSWWLIGGIIAGVIMIGVGTWLIVRIRTSRYGPSE